MNITIDQIKSLRAEASRAGDYLQAAICCVALDQPVDDISGALDADETERVATMTRADARAECARVIAEGQG